MSGASNFETFVAQQDKSDRRHVEFEIDFNSPGGSLAAGIALGEAIRKHKYRTAVAATAPDGFGWFKQVPGKCASACAFAFLGGRTRQALGGEIGVHQFYRDMALRDPNAKVFNALDLSAEQFVSALIIDYVYRMGVDPRFASLAEGPKEIRFLSESEAEELKVNWDPRKFEPWAIEPYANGVIAFSRSRDKTLLATVFCRKDRIPRLLFTDQFSYEGLSRIESAVAGLKGIEVFGQQYPRENVTPRQTPGGIGYEIVMNGFNPQLLTLSKSLGVQGDIYRSDEAFFSFRFSKENAQKTMAVALKNCI